jgi:hypothetical protein
MSPQHFQVQVLTVIFTTPDAPTDLKELTTNKSPITIGL